MLGWSEEKYMSAQNQIESKQIVLVVEDDLDTQLVFRDVVGLAGAESAVASSVAEACSAIQEQEVSLVLLDWRLGKQSGSEFLKSCRETHPLLPVIVITGAPADVQNIGADAFLAGADGFLLKPITVGVLQPLIKRWLKRYSATGKPLSPTREQEIVSLKDAKRIYVKQVVQVLGGNISLAAEK